MNTAPSTQALLNGAPAIDAARMSREERRLAQDIEDYTQTLIGAFHSARCPDPALIEDVCLALDQLLDQPESTVRSDFLEDTTLADFIAQTMKKRATSFLKDAT